MRHNEITMRRWAPCTLGVLALAGLLLGSLGISAAGADTVITQPGQNCPDPSGKATAKASQELMPGVKIGPALITTPGKPSRRLTADQATAFLQSWLPSSVYTQIPPEDPPAGVPVSTLVMNTTFAGGQVCIATWYAVQGPKVWVGMPQQGLGWATVQKDTWIVAPNPTESIKAFAGNSKPERGFAIPSTTTTAPGDSKASTKADESESSSSTWLWIVVAGVVLIGGAGIVLLARGRSKTGPDSDSETETAPEPEPVAD